MYGYCEPYCKRLFEFFFRIVETTFKYNIIISYNNINIVMNCPSKAMVKIYTI